MPLLMIIIEKAGAAVGLAAAAVLAFAFRGRALDPLSILFAGELAEDPHDTLVHWLMSLAPRLTAVVGLWLALGLAFWAVLFAAEATGLWAERNWARTLVIVETASFLPFEFWDAVHRAGPVGWATLAINVAILVYVARWHRGGRPDGGALRER